MLEVNANKLVLARYRAGLNVTDVAKSTGIARHTVSRLEQGKTLKVRATTLNKLATLYNTDITDLLI